MAILAECPVCHRKQATKNKLCSCGEDLLKAKKAKRLNYWITYRLQGKQKKESIGKSIEDARDAYGKRRVQKREKRIFDIIPEATMSFEELSKWYLDQESVKAKAYHATLTYNLSNFNSVFGSSIVADIKLSDLQNYQAKRKREGLADSTIDQEVGAAKRVIRAAFDNEKIDGRILKQFTKVKRLLKRNANARKKIITLDQFNELMKHLPLHTKQILATGFYTGMRKGEILSLTRDKVHLLERFIQLEAKDTKDREPRRIPICDELYDILERIPRALHDDHIFLFEGKPVKDIRGGLTAACEKAGISYGRKIKDGFIFHDLRHTFNTNMRKAGVAESVIMEITGHSSREMFDRYNTVDMDDAKEAVRKMEGFLQSVAYSVAQVAFSDEKGVTENSGNSLKPLGAEGGT